MRRLPLLASAASAFLALCHVLPSTAQAQAVQTFVSGTTGDDTNLCLRTSPCATWAGAFAKTAAGGEIDALDANDFGSLTITHAITIDGGGVGSIVAREGLSGITISAGTSDVVTLRNLRINGVAQASFPGLNGILINSAGMVHVENCYIYGLSKNGIVIKTSTNSNLAVNDTTISDNLNGIQLGPTGGFMAAALDRVHIHNNSNAGVFVNPTSGAEQSIAVMSRSTVTSNGTGLLVEPNGEAILNDTQFARNGPGVSVVGIGVVGSFGNNPIFDFYDRQPLHEPSAQIGNPGSDWSTARSVPWDLTSASTVVPGRAPDDAQYH